MRASFIKTVLIVMHISMLPEKPKYPTDPPYTPLLFGSTSSIISIAGTRKRGSDEREDKALEEELLKDPKERAEELMLVDLGKNGVGRVAKGGTVRVDEFMSVEKYSHVMHIVSNVHGIKREGVDSFDVLGSCFPAGTLTGAPKVRAMEIIEEVEPNK